MRLTSKQKKQVWILCCVMGILTAGVCGRAVMENRELLRDGILRGKSPDEVYEDVFVLEHTDGTRQDVAVTVYPRQLSEEEQQEFLEQAQETFEQVYLGENPSAEQVSTSLVFPEEFCQGMVYARYDADAPERIWEDGSVDTEGLDEDGELVSIHVTFFCQDAQMEYTCHVVLMPPVLSEEQQRENRIMVALEQCEKESRSEERFFLPRSIDGEPVNWHRKPGTEPFVFLALGGIAVICVVQKSRQDERKQKKEQEKQLLMEYPQMVTQLSLLIGAGMPVFTAWERMVKRYLEEQVDETVGRMPVKCMYLEEMLTTYREIKDGGSIRQAYEAFGNRIGLVPYRKMAALLIQNMNKGNRDLVRLLDLEADLALEEQKNTVRRQGEEAGTRLLFPMVLLFVMILIVIMIPALQSF